MPSRRRLIAMGVTAVGCAATVALAWGWWLPEVVRARAEAAAERRLGMDVRIEGTSLRLQGVHFDHVVLSGRHGAVRVDVGEVRVHAGLLGLALAGSAAIDGLEARRVAVHVDLAQDGCAGSIGEIGRALQASSGGDGSGPGRGRALSARDLSIDLDDEDGSLMRVHEGELRLAGGVYSLAAARVELGHAPADALRVDGLSARLRRGPSGPELLGAQASGGSLVWARRDPASDSPSDVEVSVIARVSRAVGEVSGWLATGPGDGTAPSAPRRGAGTPARPARPRWLAALPVGAELGVTGFSVLSSAALSPRSVLSQADLRLTRDEDERIHAEGSAVAGDGGALRWDLRLSPAALTGEGSVHFDDLPLALIAPLFSAIPWTEIERGRLDGDLSIRGDGPDRIDLRGHAAIRDAALSSPRIGPDPVRDLSVEVQGEAVWSPSGRRLEVPSAQVTIGQATAALSGSMQWRDDHYSVDLRATLPPTPCGRALAAIPRDLLSELGGFSWNGMLAARMRLVLDSSSLDRTDLRIHVSESCEFETVPAVADLRRFQAPFIHRVREPDGTWFEMTAGPGSGNWASIYAMSPFFVHAVLSHEDASFFHHHGFAPWAIRDALVRDLQEGRFVYGGSTITMQLAKNLFLHREKTLARKVQEVLLTWWLEKAISKAEILELYLNVIEYGPGIYGIRNAAAHYFGRDPSQLSPAQSAFLASILPAPKRYHSQYERGELSHGMANRMRRLLAHMLARGRIDQAALEDGSREIAAFRFHRPGDPPPPPAVISGTASALPYESRGPWDDAAAGWEDDGSFTDEGQGQGDEAY